MMPGLDQLGALVPVVWLIAKVTVVLGGGGLCAALLARRSAAVRHQAWALALAGVAALTVALPVLPRLGVGLTWRVPRAEVLAFPPLRAEAQQTAGALTPARSGALAEHTVDDAVVKFSAWTAGAVTGWLPVVAFSLWGVGTAVVLAWLATGHLMVRRLRRRARSLDDRAWRVLDSGEAGLSDSGRQVALVESAQTASPLTFGARRPVIVLPSGWREWPEPVRRHVLLHELAHVIRRDWFAQQLGALVCALYWFHPAAWYAWRQLRAEAEGACDDLVLHQSSDASEYAAGLVRVATPAARVRHQYAVAIGMARRSSLEQRVRAVLNDRARRDAVSHRTRRTAAVLCAVVLAPLAALSQTTWSLDARPAVVLGEDVGDTTQLFATVTGATRLPNGNLLVGDRAEMSIHEFTAAGRHVRSFGRRGQGPGEFGYIARFLRCGDSVVTWDIDGRRGSVFALEGRYVRGFRFGSPQTGSTPYTGSTSCNANMVFAHHGWEPTGAAVLGRFRADVPFWISGADSTIRARLGDLRGSERFGSGEGGRLRGTRPLPFGKQPSIAVGRDRVYIGLGDRFEILVFDLAGNRLRPIIRPDVTPERVTRADIEDMKAKEKASREADWHAAIDRDYAALPEPLYFPAYRHLVVDSEGLLWVEGYPRTRATTTPWAVFNAAGAHVATLTMPRDLEVFEIGRDYVLGRFLDADEGIPQVRMYRLNRRG